MKINKNKCKILAVAICALTSIVFATTDCTMQPIWQCMLCNKVWKGTTYPKYHWTCWPATTHNKYGTKACDKWPKCKEANE